MVSTRNDPSALSVFLGPPVRPGEEGLVEAVAQGWGVAFPSDFVSIAGAYGDVVICDYLFFCGARKLCSYAAGMGRKLEDSRTVPHRVLPSFGGAPVWGNTIEGDQLSRMVGLLEQAGLVVTARLEQEPGGRVNRPHACLLARKPEKP